MLGRAWAHCRVRKNCGGRVYVHVSADTIALLRRRGSFLRRSCCTHHSCTPRAEGQLRERATLAATVLHAVAVNGATANRGTASPTARARRMLQSSIPFSPPYYHCRRAYQHAFTFPHSTGRCALFLMPTGALLCCRFDRFWLNVTVQNVFSEYLDIMPYLCAIGTSRHHASKFSWFRRLH